MFVASEGTVQSGSLQHQETFVKFPLHQQQKVRVGVPPPTKLPHLNFGSAGKRDRLKISIKDKKTWHLHLNLQTLHLLMRCYELCRESHRWLPDIDTPN